MTIFLQLLDGKNFQSKAVFYGKIWFGWNVFLDGEKKKKIFLYTHLSYIGAYQEVAS